MSGPGSANMAGAERPKGYGMTADVAQKIADKYDERLDREARAWINAVVEGAVAYDEGGLKPETLQKALKDGTVLCKLVNQLLEENGHKPVKFSAKPINPFQMMENIGTFLTACETKFEVAKLDLFQTVSLYEGQNIPQVIDGIHALGRKVGALGAKEATENKRDFSEAQISAGKNVIGLQMGSNKGASQAGMSYGKQRQIHDPTV